jgi:glycosyltransferase involved in cell wall biosynthesis
MKICYFSSYPPSKEGVAEYTARLVHDLSNKSTKIDIITFHTNSITGCNNVFPIVKATAKGFKTTLNTLRNLKPDIIHVQYSVSIWRSLTILIWAVIRKYQRESECKIIVTLHEPQRELEYMGLVMRPFYKWIGKTADQVWVLTSQSKRLLISSCDMASKKVKIIPHGLYEFQNQDNHSDILRHNLGITHSKRIILFFGYIHIDKGVQFLIESFTKVAKDPEMEDVQLLIAGTVRPRIGMFRIFGLIDRMYRLKLKRAIKTRNIQERVTWTGFIDNSDLYSLFKLSNVIVLPYTKADQSGVLNIALVAQRPIIASDIGGFHDLLSQSGILVPARDSARIAVSIKKLLSNSSERLRLISSYKNISHNHSAPVVAKYLNKLYEEVNNS